jgi:O-antigen/teichoic acid export membrane protein
VSILFENIARRVISTTVIRGGAAASSLVLTLVIVQACSVARLGEFSAALVTIQLITIISLAGVDAIALRLLIRMHGPAGRKLEARVIGEASGCIAITSTLGVLVAFVVAGGMAWWRVDLQPIARDMMELSPLIYLLNYARLGAMILRSRGEDGAAQLIDNALPSTFAVIAIAALWFAEIDPSRYLAILYVGGAVASALISLFFIRLAPLRSFATAFRLVRDNRLRTFRVALPAQFANVANIIADWTATASLALFAPITAVAAYRVISQVNLVYLLITNGFEGPLSSAVAVAHRQGDSVRVRRLLAKSQLGMFGAALPVTIGMVLFAGPFLSLFDISSSEAALGLIVSVIACQLRMGAGTAAGALPLVDAVDLLVRTSLIALLLAVVLSFTLTPAFGLMGAVSAAASATLLRSLLSMIYLRQSLHRSHPRHLAAAPALEPAAR